MSTKNKNYDRNGSHTHCWNQGNSPACGQKIENHKQCCLCDTPAPPNTQRMGDEGRKKKRRVFDTKVSDIPFFEKGEVISREIKDKYHLNGNFYRMCFARGTGGSRKEETFDKNIGNGAGGHKCCGSKVPWRHKANCPRLKI